MTRRNWWAVLAGAVGLQAQPYESHASVPKLEVLRIVREAERMYGACEPTRYIYRHVAEWTEKREATRKEAPDGK